MRCKYIVRRMFVPFSKAPLISIGILQVIILFAVCFIALFVIKYVNLPYDNRIENSTLIYGKLLSYDYFHRYKSSYCEFVLKLPNNELKKIKSSTCRPILERYVIGQPDIRIWYKKDLLSVGNIIIYQLWVDDINGDVIIKFDEKETQKYIKIILCCIGIILICYLLIYILNTDEVQIRYNKRIGCISRN